jgi:hypothetical protein
MITLSNERADFVKLKLFTQTACVFLYSSSLLSHNCS